jgi:hypothetical protein
MVQLSALWLKLSFTRQGSEQAQSWSALPPPELFKGSCRDKLD